MTLDTARQVSGLMIVVGEQLATSIRFVKDNEPEEEFLRYRDSISKLLSTMLVEIMNPLYSEHPELKPEEVHKSFTGGG